MTPVQSDQPVAGYYQTRLAKGAVFVPVHLYHGLPVIDEEVQDRSPRWCVIVDGRTDRIESDPDHPEYRCRVPLDVFKYWPWCARYPIDQPTYLYMLAKASWAKTYDPSRPEASPKEAVNWMARKTVF